MSNTMAIDDLESILSQLEERWPEAATTIRACLDQLSAELELVRTGHDSLRSLRAANIARDLEWNVGHEKITLAFRGAELAGECGEACNIIKKLERERIGMKGSRATKSELADELADVVIAADQAAMHMGIDLISAVREKFNATSKKYGFETRLD